MTAATVVVIPARMGSSRFPGKPLAPVLGRPMLDWVISNSVNAVGRELTFVASCDREILDFATSVGVRGILTSASHERASDRTHEAVEILVKEGVDIDYVLMLQGDEPTISSDDIQRAIRALRQPTSPGIVNLMGRISSRAEWEDPNTIKAVVRNDLSALYFSRSPIPHGLSSPEGKAHKQVCAIGFSVPSLKAFSLMDPDPLEETESIDMLRWLANGRDIQMVSIDSITHPVDVASDILEVERILSYREPDS